MMMGDFGPAHGSQPGAQAGRHALEGQENFGSVGIAHRSGPRSETAGNAHLCNHSLARVPQKWRFLAPFGALSEGSLSEHQVNKRVKANQKMCRYTHGRGRRSGGADAGEE